MLQIVTDYLMILATVIKNENRRRICSRRVIGSLPGNSPKSTC